MAQAGRDNNFVPTLLGVSNVDGTTPVAVYADPTTHRLLVDLPGGTGSVTSVSVVTANGFAGTVATATSTPAITLSTTITGVLKGNGTAISAATDGTDYLSSTTGLKLDQTSAQTITVDTPIFNTLTASELVATTAAKKLQSLAVATYPSLTEISYVKGVTSAIQTQLNAKQATITFGTGVQTALGVNVGTAGSIVVNGGALGTPSSGTVTNLTGTASININGTVGATTPSTVVATTITANTGIVPDADDGAYLGQSGTAFSDLFLASGAVINFNAGNATITHSASLLTFNTPVTLGTSNAFTCGTIELGAASDTTLSRSAAGVLAVEGVDVLTTATGLPLSGGTMTGNITLGENTSIDLDPAGSADGKYSGICITGTAGATLAFGDLIYLAVADSRWELTDADATETAGTPLIGMCVLAAAGDGSATKILLQGTIRADSKFPALTIGAPAYVGETAGAIQTAIPTGADNVIRVVGRALTADELYFCPSQDHQVTVA